ncbi:hypothetical protein AVEN_102982-1 [Araneus ventricosus]|uniref:Uncharacterized protein n=1 Tax=Araneus ventricosus TaxID=182803 RepID=A0A4Y2BB11_ARAVE|nr:hypothetical protein AVEN_102982-1 [Araneus ventricosus]
MGYFAVHEKQEANSMATVSWRAPSSTPRRKEGNIKTQGEGKTEGDKDTKVPGRIPTHLKKMPWGEDWRKAGELKENWDILFTTLLQPTNWKAENFKVTAHRIPLSFLLALALSSRVSCS